MNKYKKEEIKRIFQEANLPENTKFLGYVINLEKNDEYLLETDNKNVFVWTEYPEKAKLFKIHSEALEFVKTYNKDNVTLCLLFDIGNQVATLPDRDAQEIIKLH